ncbi:MULTISPECIES: hypothetical protein [Clostridium]|uniref:Uncharacterized protein n=1 Tax=Clostridium aquiflavi TaxID=3073603 RepID=A0ABU1EGN1_9CLOT|nr:MULTISPECIES: hypothetical protein [unclassified Clostridium]MDR5587541.1 hypothetical protein [Clostridium sp. 5N-1]
MKRLMLRKVIISLLLVVSVLALNPISADAAWKQDSKGWKYGIGVYEESGWQLIDCDWYYFYTGYDKYSNESMRGYMAHDTIIDGYRMGHDGKWVDNPIFGVKDLNFREILKAKVGREYGDFLKEEFKGVTNLTFVNANVSTLKGIENLKDLNVIVIRDDELYDIEDISKLTNLRVCSIQSAKLTDMNKLIDILKKLPNLKTVSLKGNNFTAKEKQSLVKVLPKNCYNINFYY